MPPLSLLEYAQAVLCRALPCYPLKYLCEIIGIRIPNRPADVLDIHRGHGQHPLGFHHPVLCQVGCEILIKTLLKQLAEIIGADPYGSGHLLQWNIFAEILPDKVTLLAEIAEWPNEIDKNRAEAARARAEERLAHRTEAIDVKRAEFALRKALVRIDIAK